MNTLGEHIKITFFGTSHASIIGVVIDGLPPGIAIDEAFIRDHLDKRRPKGAYATQRSEPDQFEIASGYYQERTTGAPLVVVIHNADVRSSDYEAYKNTPRPAHADYPAHIKYNGYNDPRGGGMFSGRMTALWVVVGAIAEQILQKHSILIASHIHRIKTIQDAPFRREHFNEEHLKTLNSSDFPVLEASVEPLMKAEILAAKNTGDSVGGIIETVLLNVPVGCGEPYFLSFESCLSKAIFSIPAVKGIEFGDGFALTEKYGSEVNDAFIYHRSTITTASDHQGGISGGISLGSPILFKTAIKPTPSISKEQTTVHLELKQPATIQIAGRHDPAIVHRALPVINAVSAFVVLDLLVAKHRWDWYQSCTD